MPEKYAVIGKGGREHAFMWQLERSLRSGDEVIGLPGNPGMEEIGQCFAVDLDDPIAIAEAAEREGVTVALVGPEIPLIKGVVDELEKKDGIRASGCTSLASETTPPRPENERMMPQKRSRGPACRSAVISPPSYT